MSCTKKKKDNCHDTVSKWYEFSMNSRSEDEIREMILTDPDSVCYSYICMKSPLSENFIEELRVLSTELINKELYTPDNLKLVSDILSIKNLTERSKYVRELYMNNKLPYFMKSKIRSDMMVRDKLDWRNLVKYQNLSKEFIDSHQDEINEVRRMYNSQDMVAI